MSGKTGRQIRTVMSLVRPGLSRRLSVAVLIIFVLGICWVCEPLFSASTGQPRLHPAQKTLVDFCTSNLLDRVEEALSLFSDRPDKDKYIEAVKAWHERNELLESRIGQLEIKQGETIENANRVVLASLRNRVRHRDTGEIITQPREGRSKPKAGDFVLEKLETPGGSQWRIIDGPALTTIKSSGWLDLPRSKVPDSPTIILKKAIVIQIVSDGQVVSERVVFADPNSR